LDLQAGPCNQAKYVAENLRCIFPCKILNRGYSIGKRILAIIIFYSLTGKKFNLRYNYQVSLNLTHRNGEKFSLEFEKKFIRKSKKTRKSSRKQKRIMAGLINGKLISLLLFIENYSDINPVL
jgi:hypothetical protein